MGEGQLALADLIKLAEKSKHLLDTGVMPPKPIPLFPEEQQADSLESAANDLLVEDNKRLSVENEKLHAANDKLREQLLELTDRVLKLSQLVLDGRS